MRIKYLSLYIAFFFFAGNVFSQGTDGNQVITNQEIFSKLIEKSLEKIENLVIMAGKENSYGVVISGNEDEKEFIFTKVRQRLYNYKIISEKDTALSDYIILIENVNLKIKYIRIFGAVIKDRMVEREISVSFDNRLKQKTASDVINSVKVFEKYNDEFRVDKLEHVERGDYSFLKSKLPERSFFEKTLVPGIVILASAVTIVLFFIIRSK